MRWRASSDTSLWMITSAICNRPPGLSTRSISAKTRFLVRHQVDHAVGDHDVDRRVFERQLLDEPLVELDVVETHLACALAGTRQHRRGHVDSNRPTVLA